MSSLIYTSLFVVILCVVLVLLGWFLSFRFGVDREMMSPFECGFDSVGSSRVPFSLRFFLLAVIFLIFDVEVVLLFPFVSKGLFQLNFMVVFSGFIFLVILFGGLIHEWNEGSLDWSI
uniref:NADH-ubiquinone oxidoreductase chain 3 n=1 Tax=Eulepetopsis sp. TaxID=3071118 RepID=A0AA96HTQ0_9GAST|nr:NADH dehydrogenase subunit 3 [Eulepetopsis sp.]